MGHGKKRPLSLSHWSGGSFDADAVDDLTSSSSSNISMELKQELVQRVSVAAAQLCKMTHQSFQSMEKEESTLHTKMISRTLTGQLSPAIYQLLSDGLLPIVNTFFGQVTNSVWRVVEASVKKGPMLPWIEELVFCLNNEESLPEGPVRFGVFITELVNMGSLDWWLDNLAMKETILRRHYAPTGFLYLCHTATRGLMEELSNCLKPLASLPFDNSLPWKHDLSKMGAKSKNSAALTSPVNSAPTPILKSPTRAKSQRPVSYVQNSSVRTSPRPLYRRTQSQHSGLSPKKSPTENKVEEFSSLKQKWETLSSDKKTLPPPTERASSTGAVSKSSAPADGLKSRIPRPVFRVTK